MQREQSHAHCNGNIYSLYTPVLPLGKYYGKDSSGYEESDYSVYNSGDIKIEQNGSMLHVTINNYDNDKIKVNSISGSININKQNKDNVLTNLKRSLKKMF